jgi:putative endopeptidase
MNPRIVLLLCLPFLSLAAGPPKPGVDLGAMDKSANPCVDFYQYACGNWMANNPIPADRNRWGRFTELSDRNEKVLLDILKNASAENASHSAIDRKIGDYYASCMDEAAINRKGLEPLQPELDRIRQIAGKPELAAEIAHLHRSGVPVLFNFGSSPDYKDSNRTIADLDQGGLSLPGREYYLNSDAKSVEIRQRFEQHVARMLQLAGESPETAASNARAVLDFETALAKASLDRVARRDPANTYHMMSKAELLSLSPGFPWEAYLSAVGAPQFESLNVDTPDFLRQVSASAASDPMDKWKAYLGYHLLRSRADELPEAFEKESFDFWGSYLAGTKEMRPRDRRCLAAVDHELGDLLSQEYIEAAFGPDAKAQTSQMVAALEKALEEDIRTLPWMTATTKQAALAKLHAITNNDGYPKKWRDYSAVTVARDDYFGNAMRASGAARQRDLDKIGKPTDKSEWEMTTPTVNAYYEPQLNSINFPAGILQPPFFDPKRDTAVNLGAIGAVIGHEMTHGFDDQGRKYDAQGDMRDWWTPADAAEFEKRAACVANEYSAFSPIDDVKLNGRLTLGENTADNGGVRVALRALDDRLKGKKEKIDGFTPEQRLFLGYAQIWCENTAPEQLRLRAITDPHSPGRFRVNGVVQNMPEFEKAFACKAGEPMVSTNACRVW